MIASDSILRDSKSRVALFMLYFTYIALYAINKKEGVMMHE
jgi:hypothetical protein